MKKILFIAGIGRQDQSNLGGMLAKNNYLLKYLFDQEIILKTIDTFKRPKFLKFFPLRLYLLIFVKIKSLMYSFMHDEIIISDHAYGIIRLFHIFRISHKITFFVVGGSFSEKIKLNLLKKKYYTGLKNVFVESYRMKSDLINLGFSNVERVPNFKTFNKIEYSTKDTNKIVVKLFYIGRVTPEKGLNLLIEALSKVNSYDIKFTIDIYGPIDKTYENAFLGSIENKTFINYCGKLDLVNNPDEYLKLAQYHMFLFPTHWAGEGFPGVIIDSFILGKPILASNWNFNAEIVIEGYNGYIFKAFDVSDLIRILNLVYVERNELIRLGNNARLSSYKYHTYSVLKILDDVLFDPYQKK